ncbi:hypothetical protein PVAND_003673 [Polypedilum vanderplanki]|uniref:Peptidase S1 domain-containing protein n=1 Tax=Polypedilum vanderplanki TaxID=319348 RepID=A0A9J6BUS5_POLVA|nr:hypothetical protein PVAND_003673 [Polypedilum vanderplanki]
MKRCIVLISLVSITISKDIILSKYPCYKPTSQHMNYRNARIVGGYDAKRENTLYMGVLTRSGGNVFCGSSVISEKFLIVAAHCLCNSQNKIMMPNQMRVYVGINKISEINANENNELNKALEVFVEKIIIHPNYKCGKKTDTDIALLQLKRAIIFNENIRPVCLEGDDNDMSSHAVVSGFGLTNENFEIAIKPEILQSAIVELWSNEECQTSYANINKSFVISNRQICAGGRNGHSDSCYSDSGGPLIDSISGNLIGIVSNGIGCGRKGLPGVYVRVSKYKQWIQQHVLL